MSTSKPPSARVLSGIEISCARPRLPVDQELQRLQAEIVQTVLTPLQCGLDLFPCVIAGDFGSSKKRVFRVGYQDADGLLVLRDTLVSNAQSQGWDFVCIVTEGWTLPDELEAQGEALCEQYGHISAVPGVMENLIMSLEIKHSFHVAMPELVPLDATLTGRGFKEEPVFEAQLASEANCLISNILSPEVFVSKTLH